MPTSDIYISRYTCRRLIIHLGKSVLVPNLKASGPGGIETSVKIPAGYPSTRVPVQMILPGGKGRAWAPNSGGYPFLASKGSV